MTKKKEIKNWIKDNWHYIDNKEYDKFNLEDRCKLDLYTHMYIELCEEMPNIIAKVIGVYKED